MLAAIQFYNQFQSRRTEINNIWADKVLAAKAMSIEGWFTKLVPKHGLLHCRFTAHFSCTFFIPFFVYYFHQTLTRFATLTTLSLAKQWRGLFYLVYRTTSPSIRFSFWRPTRWLAWAAASPIANMIWCGSSACGNKKSMISAGVHGSLQ